MALIDKDFNEKELMIAAFNHCAEVIIVINEDGEIVKTNEKIKDFFGYNNDDLLGHPLEILFPERYREKHKQHLKYFFQSPAQRPMGSGRELYALHSKGTEFPVEVSLSSFEKEHKKYGIAFVTDVTSRKENEKKLINSEKRLEATIETAVDGICTINEKGLILNVNNALCELFGYTKEDLIGEKVETLMPQDTGSEHNKYVGNYMGGGVPKIIGVGRNVMAQKHNGDEFPIRLSIGKFQENDQTLFTGIIHDMTAEATVKKQLKHLNNELEQRVEDRTKELADLVVKLEKINVELDKARVDAHVALEKEKELSELKSRFVSMASHEFRTPLSTILSSTTLLKKYEGDDVDDKKEKHFNRIKKNVLALTRILNDFLSLDKLESGAVKCNKKEINLREIVNDITDELYTYLKVGQKIAIEFLGDEKFFTDPSMMRNVVINLLSNASKYSPEQSSIELLIDNSISTLTKIEVKDHGIGIPEEEQKLLFKRFFRAKNAINIQGTGLGLNIVRKYVELMGGEISFKSDPETGTIFTLLFKHI